MADSERLTQYSQCCPYCGKFLTYTADGEQYSEIIAAYDADLGRTVARTINGWRRCCRKEDARG